jgi:tetratricopeptide (TPR) repeat protein
MFNWIKQYFSASEKAVGPAEFPMPPITVAAPAPDATESVKHKEQGDVHLRNGNFTAAAQCYRQAISLDPGFAKAHRNLGFALKEQGQYADAQHCLARALALDPSFADAHYMLAALSQADNKPDAASLHFRKALELAPDFKIVYRDLCYLLFQSGRMEEAKQVIVKGIALNPAYAELHYYLGNLHNEDQQLDAAIASFQNALTIRPDYAEALAGLGLVLFKKNDLDPAIAVLQKALTLNPNLVDAYNNLGNAWYRQNKFDSAIGSYKQGIAVDPRSDRLHYNFGRALHAQNKLTEAIAHYHTALTINPNYTNAQANRGLALLLIGNFEAGWKDYEYRWTHANGMPRPKFTQPLWLNDADINGKSILLYAEQGLGDTIQFIRYIERVAVLGATVYVEVQSPLKSLLASLPGVAAVLAKGEPLPAFDYHCPLASLPLAFNTDLASIPSKHAYITAPAEKTAYWAAQLQDQASPRIGIVWSGNAAFKNDHNRSIELQTLAPLLANEKYRFFSLQKEVPAGDAELLKNLTAVTHLGNRLSDFSETAAIIANLDLVITVDTAVAHLAGALGKPVWIFLPFVPDFRWLLDRADSPWYPTARLFRQPTIGDWSSAIEAVRHSLESTYRTD